MTSISVPSDTDSRAARSPSDSAARTARRPATFASVVWASVVAGLFGGLLVFVVEAADRLVTLWPSFNSAGEAPLFALYLSPVIFLGLSAGLVLGPALALLGGAIAGIERFIAKYAGRAASLIACALFAAAVATVAAVAIEAIRQQLGMRSLGRLASVLSLYFMDAGSHILSRLALTATPWVFPLLVGAAFAVAVGVALLPRLARPESPRAVASSRVAAVAAVALVVLVYWFDSRFEFGRYDSMIHVPAALLQCALAVFAALTAIAGRAGFLATRAAAAILVFATLGGAFALVHVGTNENLKALLWRRSVVSRRAYEAAVFVADRDRDGFSPLFAGGDADDGNPAVHPLAAEVPGNGVDDNCIGGDLAQPTPPGAPGAAPAARGKRFVLIAIDTQRADRMSLYGYGRPTTPGIDEHAQRGLVFDRCYSHGTNTAVAFSSMQTSASRGAIFEPDRERLFARLYDAGFATGQVNAVIESDWLRAKSSSRAYRSVILDGIDRFPHELGEQFWDADAVTDAAIEYLESLPADAPSATWVHYFDPHTPRRKMAPFDFGDSASDKYDSEVAFADREVARLLEWMRTSGFMEDAIVILTSDHGEAFLEHGMDFHGNRPYSEQIDIPLVIWAPGLAPGRTSAPASIIDVAPTVLEFLGQRPLSSAEGLSLLGPVDDDRPIFSETPLNIVDGPFFAYAVTQGRWRLIYDVVGNTTELYDLAADPRELHNLADADPQRAAAMRATIARWLDTTRAVATSHDALTILEGEE